MAEVERRYREHSGKRFTKFALFKATGIGRTTLDNWLEIGVMPEPGGLAKVATAIGTEPAVLKGKCDIADRCWNMTVVTQQPGECLQGELPLDPKGPSVEIALDDRVVR